MSGTEGGKGTIPSDYEHWSHTALVAFAEKSRTEVNRLRCAEV